MRNDRLEHVTRRTLTPTPKKRTASAYGVLARRSAGGALLSKAQRWRLKGCLLLLDRLLNVPVYAQLNLLLPLPLLLLLLLFAGVLFHVGASPQRARAKIRGGSQASG